MTRRATHPLNQEAVRAANAAVFNMTDPPGRPLSPTDPRDAAARRAWMDAYEGAGGHVTSARRGPPIDEPIASCPRPNWVELNYLHCDGSPVPGARYTIEGEGFTTRGVLDDDGFTHVDGVPDGVGAIEFRFERDPEEYVPRPPAITTSQAESRDATSQAFRDVLDWLWGTIQGDFNEDPTIGQTAVNAVIGLIPIADQVLDVRDLIAGILHLIQYYLEDEEEQQAHPDSLGLSYETWLWLGLFLIALGCIPEVGSAVKGVLKSLIKLLQDAGRAAGGLSARQLVALWERLVAVLNRLGLRQGNAHRWLNNLRNELPRYLDAAAVRVRDAVGVFRRFLEDLAAQLRRLDRFPGVDSAWVRRTTETIRRAMRALDEILSKLERQKRIINEWLAEQLRRVLGGRGTTGGTGSVNTHPGGAGGAPPAGAAPANGPNQVVQPAEPPGEPHIPPRRATTAERMDDLRRQGHGPQRHEGQVTRAQLEDRVLHGTDPETGSNINPNTGQPYPPPRRATRITSEEAYADAEQRMRTSQEFADAPVQVTPNGQRRKAVEMPLDRAIGPDYQQHVEGVTRIGSAANPTGTRATNLDGGSMTAIYVENDQGGWDLLTMYPEPLND